MIKLCGNFKQGEEEFQQEMDSIKIQLNKYQEDYIIIGSNQNKRGLDKLIIKNGDDEFVFESFEELTKLLKKHKRPNVLGRLTLEVEAPKRPSILLYEVELVDEKNEEMFFDFERKEQVVYKKHDCINTYIVEANLIDFDYDYFDEANIGIIVNDLVKGRVKTLYISNNDVTVDKDEIFIKVLRIEIEIDNTNYSIPLHDVVEIELSNVLVK